jgi:SAM-dependent methyltransferase
MSDEVVRELDAEALALFARKGCDAGVRQLGRSNGPKVRRIMQLTRDLALRPFETLRILDLGCGEGVYAIEAGVRGAHVLALDARTERMALGAACAARHGLSTVRFTQEDVRRVTREIHGEFDVVYALGLLYHLDAPDVFRVLENIYALCADLLLVDTFVSSVDTDEVAWRGRAYRGQRWREHEDGDSPEVRRGRVLRSIDNTFAFRLTRASLVQALRDVGFTSVLECHVPIEPDRPDDRVTLAARKGRSVRVSTYPWVNDKSDAEIARELGAGNQSSSGLS